MSTFYEVCSVAEVPTGGSKMFLVNDSPIAIFNLDGKFFALANECPHAGASLAHGEINDDCISCRIHHWRFSIRDGTYLDEDKPRYNVRCFELRRTNGTLEVKLDN